MENINITGFVINSLDYKESSKIVYLYTKEGKKSIKVLGAKSQKKGYLPFLIPLTLVSATITNSSFPTLIEYTVLNSYQYIKDDLKKELIFSYIFEILNKMPDDSFHDKIFNMLENLFTLAKTYDSLLLCSIFKIKMLYTFGVNPNFKTCGVCGSGDVYYFSVHLGGAICKKCYHIGAYDNQVLNILKYLYFMDLTKESLEKIKDINVKEIFDIILSYYKEHVNIYLKGYKSLIY